MTKFTLQQASALLKINGLKLRFSLKSPDKEYLTADDLKDLSGKLSLDLFELAAEYIAAKWHKDQTYGNEPYTYHLKDVVRLVHYNFKGKVDTYTLSLLTFVAWLHDFLEDVEQIEAAEQELKELVGEDPRYDIALTSMKAISKGYFDAKETNEEYLIRLLRDPYAPAVKISDSESNLFHSIADGKVKLINKYTKNLAFIANHGYTTKSVKNLTIV